VRGWSLGLRFALRPIGAGRSRNLLFVLGFGLGALLLTFAITLLQANSSQVKRTRLIAPSIAKVDSTFHVVRFTLPWNEQPWTTMYVAADRPKAPAPRGLSSFPRAGEVWLSPALAHQLRSNQDLRERLPGETTGQIAAAGLASPTQLLAIVGMAKGSLGNRGPAVGWGAPGIDYAESALPTDSLWLSLSTLAGIPLLFFLLTISRLSSQARARRATELVMLGASNKVIARAAGVETGILAGLGSLLGYVVACAITPLVAAQGWFGITWYSADTPPNAYQALITVVLISIIVAQSSKFATRTRRRNGSRGPGRGSIPGLVACAPMAVCSSVLLGFVATGVFAPDRHLATGPLTLIFAVTALASVGGALLALPWIAEAIAAKPTLWGASTTSLMAKRRLQADARATTRVAGALVLTMVTSLLAVAVLDDIQSLVRPAPAGHVVDAIFPRDATLLSIKQALEESSAPTLALRLPVPADGSESDRDFQVAVLTCSSLYRFVPSLNGHQVCEPGRSFSTGGNEVADGPVIQVAAGATVLHNQLPAPASTIITAQDLRASFLDGVSVIVTQEPLAWAASSRSGDLVALPGPGEKASDTFVTRVLSRVPLSLINYDDVDTSNLYRLPAARKAVLSFAALGLIAALATFLMTSADLRNVRRRDNTSLIVLGMRSSDLVLTEVKQSLLTTIIALGVGVWTGWLVGVTYLTLGGHHVFFRSGLQFALVVSAVSVVFAVSVNIRPPGGAIRSEHLKRA